MEALPSGLFQCGPDQLFEQALMLLTELVEASGERRSGEAEARYRLFPYHLFDRAIGFSARQLSHPFGEPVVHPGQILPLSAAPLEILAEDLECAQFAQQSDTMKNSKIITKEE